LIERQPLEDLLRQNLSTPKIAARLGVSESGVRYWEEKYDLKTAFGPHGKGRRMKSPNERARDMVREVSTDRRRLKSRAIAYKGGKCILCGYDRCNAALEFHHLDRTIKSFGLSRKGFTRSWDSIKTELDKCILICANCHREVEAGARTFPSGV
jgi:hypothetical protein